MTTLHLYCVIYSYFEESWERSTVTEVLFPKRHVAHLPWRPYDWNEVPHNDLKGVELTIKSLCHVTHKEAFEKICKMNPHSYTLQASRKKGKSGEKFDGSPTGNSFIACDRSGMAPCRASKYKYIKPSEDLLPGCYSWWSIHIARQDMPKPRSKLNFAVSAPFSDPPGSRYGSKAIYSSIKYVFESYQASLPKDPSGKLPKIQLRNGGTLRYRYEVCYVIIVCAENESTLLLDEYPLWEEGENKIQFNGRTGAVSWVNSITVTFGNGMTKKEEYYPWDQFAFAFHYPDENCHMICPTTKNKFKYRDMEHNKTTMNIEGEEYKKFKCLKSGPIVPNGEFICPDERMKRKRHTNSHEDEKQSKKIRLNSH